MRATSICVVAILALGAVAIPSTSYACGPAMGPGQVRTYASEIFVGRVLERTALESRLEGSQHVTLYKLTVHVDSALKGSAVSGELTTLYMIARTDFSDTLVEETQEKAGTGLYLYDVPETPLPLMPYIFFAKPFADGEYVLFENTGTYLEIASGQLIEQTQAMIMDVAYMY